jgi:hypothetical protein
MRNEPLGLVRRRLGPPGAGIGVAQVLEQVVQIDTGLTHARVLQPVRGDCAQGWPDAALYLMRIARMRFDSCDEVEEDPDVVVTVLPFLFVPWVVVSL